MPGSETLQVQAAGSSEWLQAAAGCSRRQPELTLATTQALTGANGQKAEAEFPFCPRSFDRAVMVAQPEWYNLRLVTRETWVRTLPWASRWSRDHPVDISSTPTLPHANLRYQEALDWRKWTKGGRRIPLLSAQF